jgi:four helix bundle protein
MTPQELQNRLRKFAYKVVELCKKLPFSRISKIIEDQLLRSAFSAAANYRAACKAQSLKAFCSKLSISLEEMDESCFWLESIADLKLIVDKDLQELIKEADELTRILAASRKSVQTRLKS